MKELEGDGYAGHGWMLRIISEESEGEWGVGGGVNQGHTPVVSQKSTCDDAHVKWAKHSPPPRAHTAEGHQVLHNVQVLSP